MTEDGGQGPERAAGAGAACRRCEAPLAPDQRYCLECGTRVGPLALPGRAPQPMAEPQGRRMPVRVPRPRSAGALAAITLAFGVFVGFAIGPSISGVGFAGGQLVVNVPGQAQSSTNGSRDTASPSTGGSVTLGSPVGNAGGGRSSPPPAAVTPVAAAAPPPASPAPPPAPPEPPPPSHKPASPRGGGPTPPERVPPTLGTVVHLNPVAGSYTLATSGGELMPVHADQLPKAGSRVSVVTHQLFNGTFAEKGKRTTKGDEKRAKLTGYVSYRDPTAHVYVLSVRGASILIHVPDEGSAGSAAIPPLGAYTGAVVAIAQPQAKEKHSRVRGGATTTGETGCTPGTGPDAGSGVVLNQTDAKFTVPPAQYVDMEGIVGATCTDPGELTLSADDVRESTQNLLLAAPSPIDVTKLEPGQAIDVTAELGDDGSYTVTGLSSDQGVDGASDRSAAQGDQAP
jgi:hypothetical protein